MNKQRYFAASVVFLCLAFLMLELAGNVHLLLSVGTSSVTLNPLLLARLLLSSRKALMMYLLLLGFAALFVWWGLFGRSYLNYHSKMFEVVPGFEIPMPEGQGQHGTAWWLEAQEFDKHFASIDTSAPVPLPANLQQSYQEEGRAIHEMHD